MMYFLLLVLNKVIGFPSHGKLQNGCTQQTTIQVFLKQKWVHLIVLYAKIDGYTKYMDTNKSQKAVSC